MLLVPWSTVCVTSPQHTLFRHLFQSACGRHPTPRVAELSTPTHLFAVWHAPGCTMEKHFLCCFVGVFFSPFLSGALRTCNPETHSSVHCAMSVFTAYVSDFTASSHFQLQSQCLGNRCIPLIAPPWYG